MCARAYIEKLPPTSQVILDYIQERRGYIEKFRMIYAVQRRTGESHSGTWYFRRLVCLALEGRIEAKVSRTGETLNVKFRRLQENGLEELPDIEEAEGLNQSPNQTARMEVEE